MLGIGRVKDMLQSHREATGGPRWIVKHGGGPNRAQRRAEQAKARRENRQARRVGKLPGRKPGRTA